MIVILIVFLIIFLVVFYTHEHFYEKDIMVILRTYSNHMTEVVKAADFYKNTGNKIQLDRAIDDLIKYVNVEFNNIDGKGSISKTPEDVYTRLLDIMKVKRYD